MFRHLRQVVAPEHFLHVSKLSKLNDTKARTQARTKFLLDCKHAKVTPPSLTVSAPIRSPRLRQATATFQHAILNAAIRDNFVSLRKLTHDMDSIPTTFLTPDDLLLVQDFLTTRSKRLYDTHQLRLNAKLARLTLPSNPTPRRPEVNPIFNFTTSTIPPKVTAFLELGPKYNLNSKPIPLIDIVAPLEAQLHHHPEYDDATRQRIARLLTATHTTSTRSESPPSPLPLRTFLREHPTILLLRSDKGGSPVFMERQEYQTKILALLEDVSTFQIVPSSGNTKMKDAVQTMVQQWTTEAFITKAQAKYMTIACPQPPRIHGLPKIHKPGVPLRPIVDFRNSPTYYLSKFLSRSLLATNFPEDRSCSNSYEFLRMLRDDPTPLNDDFCMVSFDVTSLFTNVPVTTACELIRKHWAHVQPNTPLDADSFIAGILLCAEATIIQFHHKFYRQIFGCPMGSALSGALANIVMIDLESSALLQIPPQAIRIYTRYVDDIFSILRKLFLQRLLAALNAYHPRLQLTIEHELERRLPFLDIMVSHDQFGVHTTVYSKPTNSHRYLDFLSPSPPQHKYATARSLLARAVYFPDNPDEQQRQVKFWLTILESNNYPSKYLQRILTIIRQADTPRALQPFTRLPTPEMGPNPKPTQWVAIPYIRQIHQRLQNLLPTEVKLAPIAHDQLYQLYSIAKDQYPDGAITNVIYSIPCKPVDGSICTTTYIGQTSLSIRKRISNHRSAYNKRPLESSLFAHVSSQPGEHAIDFDRPSIIDHAHNRKELYIREAWAIQNSTNIMNAALECTPLPGPFRGLQQAANSVYLKLGSNTKRVRPKAKPLHILWRSTEANQQPQPDLNNGQPIAPQERPGLRHYALRQRH